MSSKNSVTILRTGLALVFLANALVAWFSPQEFADLIGGSFIVNIFPAIPVSALVTLVLINDSLLALIFLFNFKKIMKYALAWASIWIILVILVIWQPMDALEHLGFLAISVVLFLELGKK